MSNAVQLSKNNSKDVKGVAFCPTFGLTAPAVTAFTVHGATFFVLTVHSKCRYAHYRKSGKPNDTAGSLSFLIATLY